MDKNLEKIVDLFMFREGTEEDDYSTRPIITTGSIVWGVILRSLIIIFLTFFLLDRGYGHSVWVLLFVYWFAVVFPAYRQYQKFNKRMDKFQEETLCGSCRHFIPGSQLCSMYDEHVSKDYIPCDGNDWEPKY